MFRNSDLATLRICPSLDEASCLDEGLGAVRRDDADVADSAGRALATW